MCILLSELNDAMADAADATNESMRCSSNRIIGTMPPVFFTCNWFLSNENELLYVKRSIFYITYNRAWRGLQCTRLRSFLPASSHYKGMGRASRTRPFHAPMLEISLEYRVRRIDGMDFLWKRTIIGTQPSQGTSSFRLEIIVLGQQQVNKRVHTVLFHNSFLALN